MGQEESKELDGLEDTQQSERGMRKLEYFEKRCINHEQCGNTVYYLDGGWCSQCNAIRRAKGGGLIWRFTFIPACIIIVVLRINGKIEWDWLSLALTLLAAGMLYWLVIVWGFAGEEQWENRWDCLSAPGGARQIK